MRAMVLEPPGSVESAPLVLTELPVPEPGVGEMLIKVEVCGVCRTDLHVVEGELPPHRQPIIPGYEVVGRIVKCGPDAGRFAEGGRVGVA